MFQEPITLSSDEEDNKNQHAIVEEITLDIQEENSSEFPKITNVVSLAAYKENVITLGSDDSGEENLKEETCSNSEVICTKTYAPSPHSKNSVSGEVISCKVANDTNIVCLEIQEINTKKPVIMPTASSSQHNSNDNLILYNKFVDMCVDLQKSDFSQQDIEALRSKLTVGVNRANKDFVKSDDFAALIKRSLNNFENSAHSQNTRLLIIKEMLDNLKLQRTKITLNTLDRADTQNTDSSEVLDDRTETTTSSLTTAKERDIMRLTKTLHKLNRKIKKLDEAEVDFDDEVNSPYIRKIKYEKRFILVQKKLNELSGTPKLRKKKIRLTATSYPSLNTAMEEWISKKRVFPDYREVLQAVQQKASSISLPLTSDEMGQVSRLLFTEMGEKLSDIRKKELWESMEMRYLYENNDNNPIEEDDELSRKLKENSQIYKAKMQQVINHFVEKQEAKNLQPEEVADDAPTSDENEPEEEEEEENLSSVDNQNTSTYHSKKNSSTAGEVMSKELLESKPILTTNVSKQTEKCSSILTPKKKRRFSSDEDENGKENGGNKKRPTVLIINFALLHERPVLKDLGNIFPSILKNEKVGFKTHTGVYKSKVPEKNSQRPLGRHKQHKSNDEKKEVEQSNSNGGCGGAGGNGRDPNDDDHGDKDSDKQNGDEGQEPDDEELDTSTPSVNESIDANDNTKIECNPVETKEAVNETIVEKITEIAPTIENTNIEDEPLQNRIIREEPPDEGIGSSRKIKKKFKKKRAAMLDNCESKVKKDNACSETKKIKARKSDRIKMKPAVKDKKIKKTELAKNLNYNEEIKSELQALQSQNSNNAKKKKTRDNVMKTLPPKLVKASDTLLRKTKEENISIIDNETPTPKLRVRSMKSLGATDNLENGVKTVDSPNAGTSTSMENKGNAKTDSDEDSDIEIISESVSSRKTQETKTELTHDQLVQRFLAKAMNSNEITIKRKRTKTENLEALEKLKRMKGIQTTRICKPTTTTNFAPINYSTPIRIANVRSIGSSSTLSPVISSVRGNTSIQRKPAQRTKQLIVLD